MTTTTEARFLNILNRLRTLPFLQLPEDMELSRPAITLISWIATFPGCGVVDIADGLGLSPPTISVGIRRLVRGGWLERRRDPNDGRSRLIFLTPKGNAFLERLQIHQTKMFQAFLSVLNQQEQEMLLSLLEQALEAISEHPERLPG